ncbi:MAG: hypothetical protein K0U64_00035 [Actinomycetia bacterium]|nr:hypothetical protein [Actinomycetes bacterium]
MAQSQRRTTVVAELLRLIIVVFGAGVGYQVAIAASPDPDTAVLGLLTPTLIGVVVGAGLGYSLGGVFARYLVKSLDRGERLLDGVTPEELVAGTIGGALTAVVVAIVTWPVFILLTPLVASSIFIFLVVLGGAFGFSVGRHRRGAVLGTVGGRGGVAVTKRASTARLIDTSVAIDGRIIDVVRAGFGHGRIVVCQPVLDELQQLSDSGDDRRRSKGRRGLETLEKLRHEAGIDVLVIPDSAQEVTEVDAKLIRIAMEQELALLTLDTGLAKVAAVSGVHVQDMHALALALRPPVQAGDSMTLRLLREGKEVGQAVGYLDDGTMVVVEKASKHLGEAVGVEATSVLTTSNGRMVFAKINRS